MAAKKKNTEGFAFITAALTKDKKVSYADIKVAAEKKGLTIHPIMYGRAQAMMGIVKSAKRGTGKFAQATREKAAGGPKRGPGRPPKVAVDGAPRRGPGRPRKNPLPAAMGDGLEGIVAAVKASQQDLGRYRGALEKIQEILAGALD